MSPFSNKAREHLQLEMHYQVLMDRKQSLSRLREEKRAEFLRERNHQIFAHEKKLTLSEKASLFESFCSKQQENGHPVLIREERPEPWESFDFLTRILWESYVRSSLEKQLFEKSVEDELEVFLKTEDIDRKLKQTMAELSDVVLRLEKINNPSGQMSLF